MGALFKKIRECVNNGRYVVGQHAAERLEERGILEWQVVDGIEDGALLVERPGATPNPIAEINQFLADGSEVKAVWSYMISVDTAKLVTVHFYDD
ncbi:MAG TPA: DUF4258 domain-containing protein [Tepidisphaeraceae bacterium]|jgi:hypothetical protein|nr:DUF4258 domain-containing protein [Tepidisphaeraceae bacterium]